MNSSSNFATLLGRILIVLLYFQSGFSKIGNFEGATGYVASAGLPLPAVGAALAVVVETLVALALLLGWQARWAALVMAVFTIAAALFFHKYWAAPPEAQMGQFLNFYKNLSIAGGLLFIYAFGPGQLSLDAKAGRA
jgi:putative oxidoreductase